jgi:hypothetical protein
MAEKASGRVEPEAAPGPAGKKPLTPAAERALAEAAARRSERERNAKTQSAQTQSPELSGRGGLDPVRYGDWEVKGLASDF